MCPALFVEATQAASHRVKCPERPSTATSTASSQSTDLSSSGHASNTAAAKSEEIMLKITTPGYTRIQKVVNSSSGGASNSAAATQVSSSAPPRPALPSSRPSPVFYSGFPLPFAAAAAAAGGLRQPAQMPPAAAAVLSAPPAAMRPAAAVVQPFPARFLSTQFLPGAPQNNFNQR